MGRDNYNEGFGRMGDNAAQNRMIRNAAKQVGISEQELSDEIHSRKATWYSGDYTYSQLLDIARKILKEKNKK